MGWSSGSTLMSEVIAAMKNANIPEHLRAVAYDGIIDAFRNEDCDTLDECIGEDHAFDVAIGGSLKTIEPAPVEPDRVQLEKIMDCEDRDWDYFARTDPTPKARDFVSGVRFSPLPIFVSIDSISVVDCETHEEMLKPPTDADIESWSKPATPYVVELRSDDNEPLTVEWLNAVRPIRSSSLLEQGWPIGESSFCYFDIHRGYGTDKLFLWICVGGDTSVKTIEVHTRGEVRQICRALKAEVPK